jgi:hypothetical protein
MEAMGQHAMQALTTTKKINRLDKLISFLLFSP